MHYMASQSTMSKTIEDLFHDSHLQLQEQMRNPIVFNTEMMGDIIRVGYRFGFFGWYSVVISWFLPNQYWRKTWLVHFGIIILAGTPFFLKRGVTAPFFRGPAPILRKKGFPAKPLRVPAKFFSAQNTDRNTDQPAPVYGISIPILAKLPVSNGIQL